MAGFEEQGKFAVSCEPLSEWCDENGIDTRASACPDVATKRYNKIWNDLIRSKHDGDYKAAEIYMEALNQ